MRVAVVGAGVAGLTFAAAMRRLAPTVEVALYEKEAAPTAHPGGYSLGLRGDAGLSVLKRLGLYDELAAESVVVANFAFLDQRGRHLLDLRAGADDRRRTERITRRRLTALLARAAEDIAPHYGCAVASYANRDTGAALAFADGAAAEADVVIAADGVNSRLRAQMIGDQTRYLGLTAIAGEAPSVPPHPLIEGGYFMTLGDDGASVLCYRQDNAVHLSYTVRVDAETRVAGRLARDLLGLIVDGTADWHDPIPEIARRIDPRTVVVRGYYDREPASRIRNGNVWLIGDAAHPISPFQGQGANMAMVDALRLAEHLATVGDAASAAKVEADIVKRGRRAILQSRRAAEQFHTTDRFQRLMRDIGFRVARIFIPRG